MTDDRVSTTNDDPERTTTGIVTIRISNSADGDLVTDAAERLSRAQAIDDVTIEELRSIDPKLSATVITVGITLRWTTTMTDVQARERLAEVPGLMSTKQIG